MRPRSELPVSAGQGVVVAELVGDRVAGEPVEPGRSVVPGQDGPGESNLGRLLEPGRVGVVRGVLGGHRPGHRQVAAEQGVLDVGKCPRLGIGPGLVQRVPELVRDSGGVGVAGRHRETTRRNGVGMLVTGRLVSAPGSLPAGAVRPADGRALWLIVTRGGSQDPTWDRARRPVGDAGWGRNGRMVVVRLCYGAGAQ